MKQILFVLPTLQTSLHHPLSLLKLMIPCFATTNSYEWGKQGYSLYYFDITIKKTKNIILIIVIVSTDLKTAIIKIQKLKPGFDRGVIKDLIYQRVH